MATQEECIRDPFLCFTSAFVESKTLCHMNFKKEETFSLTLSNTSISKWVKFGVAVFSCCVRVPGGNVGILKKIRDLSNVFVGPILVFDNGMSPAHCQSAGVNRIDRVIIVRDTSDIINNLPQSHPLSGDQRVLLRQTLFERRRRLFPEAGPPPQQQAEQAYADLFVEAFIERRFIEAPPPEMWANPSGVFMQMVMFPHALEHGQHQDDTNDDFARAQTASMEEYERERERRASNLENPRPTRRQRTRQPNATRQPKPTRKLPQEWPSILKEARPAEDGDCVCLTCVDMAATICFVPCGHQALCDNCVKKMWEMPGVQRKCPLCNAVPDSIVRPVTTERK